MRGVVAVGVVLALFSLRAQAAPAEGDARPAVPACPLIAITPGVIGTLQQGAPFELQLTASGGTPPYQYVAQNGPDPLPGLTLSSTGLLQGAPQLNGNFAFVVRAVDQSSCEGAQAYSISVSCPLIEILPYPSLPVGDLGAAYEVQITATGGIAPYTLVASGVPDGLEFSTTGLLAGTPRALGGTIIIITATDSTGCERQLTYTFDVDVSNPPGCEAGAGHRPASLVVVLFALVMTLRRRRVGSARCR
jgi:hypothetical protein